ncbi:MAG: HD domain-containing protein [candidate division Zixibacteria bacterium]|nr:HD domain-containing protein [candidate division Zixibacteria bacterium]
MAEQQAASPITRSLAGQSEERLLTLFFGLYKTARIIEEHNTMFLRQCEMFFDLLKQIGRNQPTVMIKIVAERYFVNQQMVRYDDELAGALTVQTEWAKLGIGGVQFDADIAQSDIRRFFPAVSQVRPGADNLNTLKAKLENIGLTGITLLSAKDVETELPEAAEDVRRHFRTMARATFFTAVSVMQEVVVSTTQQREINIARTKRVVHSLIDHLARDESSLLELTAIKDFDDYTYAHSTDVCVYALTLGGRLGLDRPRLSQLGFAALFHDIGKAKLPRDLIRKPDAFDEDDWVQMQRHPLLGAKTILRNMKLDMHTARAARAAFEHHINMDFTGYPTLRHERRQPALFSRIVSIADTFDALTSGRVYMKKSIPPDVVIKKMRFQMQVKFDPFLLKLFNDVIGIYPAGSLVLLTTDEIALVLTNNEQDRARPYVKIVGDRSGLLQTPIWTDLSLPENESRKIVRLIDPVRYGLDAKQFILSD